MNCKCNNEQKYIKKFGSSKEQEHSYFSRYGNYIKARRTEIISSPKSSAYFISKKKNQFIKSDFIEV